MTGSSFLGHLLPVEEAGCIENILSTPSVGWAEASPQRERVRSVEGEGQGLQSPTVKLEHLSWARGWG